MTRSKEPAATDPAHSADKPRVPEGPATGQVRPGEGGADHPKAKEEPQPQSEDYEM
jgi:hypothetical protein